MPDNYSDRRYVYAFMSCNGTFFAVNYDPGNNGVNTFLWRFDVWDNNGDFRRCADNDNLQEAWYELPMELWDAFHTEAMQRAFSKMHSTLTFECPSFVDPTSTESMVGGSL